MISDMGRPWRAIVIAVVAAVAVVLTPAAAAACRITNASLWGDHSTEIYIWFDCGHGCGSYYKIQPGKYVNTDSGQDGYVQACTPPSAGKFVEPQIYENSQMYMEDGRLHLDGSDEGRFKLNDGIANGYSAVVHWERYLPDNDLYQSVDHPLENAEGSTSEPYCWFGTA